MYIKSLTTYKLFFYNANIKTLLASLMNPSLIFGSATKCAKRRLIPTFILSQFPRSTLSIRSCVRILSTYRAMEEPQIQLVEYQGKDYHVIKEGLAKILNPPAQQAASKGTKKDLKSDDQMQSVFYNPIQQFNRDLSVLAIRAHGEHIIDLKKQKAAEKLKKQAGNGEKKRKREDDQTENPRPAPNAEHKETTETTIQPVSAPPADQEPKLEAGPEQPAASFTVLDALSATGLRALRYASELPFVTKVVANDLSASAIKSMKKNIEYNDLKTIQPNLADARVYMYGLDNASKFDVIDLDPYGTAAPFMDAAVQAAKDGGLLCVTCTDAGVWASTGYSEKAFSLYGGIPMKGLHSHEGGLRLILNSLAMSAAKYGMAIEPLLSLSIDFYARVFIRVYRSPAQVKFTAGNTMLVYNCDVGCGAWTTQPLGSTRSKLDRKGNPVYHHGLAKGPTAGPHCEHCGTKTHLAGPMWGGPLHNPQFIQKILDMLPGADPETYQTCARIEGMLTTALEEDLDLSPSKSEDPAYPAIIPRMDVAAQEKYPFYFSISALAKVLHTTTPPIDEFRGALSHLGYRSTRSHTKPNSIRTDAPWEVIWEVMREWVRQVSPIKETSLKARTAGAAIMAKSRENLRKLDDEDQWLSLLKKDLMSAVETGKDVSDLVTKVEAALYRSGPRNTSQNAPASAEAHPSADAAADPQPVSDKASAHPSKRPHPSTLEVVFDEELGRQVSAAHTKKRLVRYQLNPRANWGPLNRAGRR
ncbi:tRNA (guanine(26)-N(2))-dimethyltransferase [Penicillium cf. griseofulvum]|uniref:tRNA (guanine(26)-N(2))-dimethyltransferase n=1 Tax=Penicillium cf. griseofulvum TaxID=2972120 RepID=A0A9W9M045_9EURO|nr:tRNA (guanine(26)-N(2))-dimethyltransferase [Penicillium cf. griseofulvum]KAJ5430561.1 tRNA (guanine(26)-N(2))-dimethyltransferase [Penicillium cf. griseofulvum]KAJ5435670.1 tRNA (guanine(26)-N(2))-dimethyltransferase [Penicillium cf. griseofulvum]